MKYISKWVGIKRRIKVGPVLIRIRSVLGIAYSLIKETLSIAGLDPTDTVEFGDFFLLYVTYSAFSFDNSWLRAVFH